MHRCAIAKQGGIRTFQIDERQNGQAFGFSAGDTFQLCLPENRSTGFRWVFEADGSPACKIVEDRTTPGSPRPGAPGAHCWTFQAIAPGQGRIVLRSRRPWEPRGGGGQVFTINLRVRH